MNAPPDLLALAGAKPVTAPSTSPAERLIAQAGPDTFDWSADNPDIAIREQPATACYVNPFGSVVIRQEMRTDDDEDHFVHFRPENIPSLIAKLRSLIDERR